MVCFKEQISEQASSFIQFTKDTNLKTWIVSGDDEESVVNISQ